MAEKTVQLYDDEELAAEVQKQLELQKGDANTQINMSMLREAAGVSAADAEKNPDKIAQRLIQLEDLDLSFKGIGKISTLEVVNNVTQLQLQNNRIRCIENLDFLLNLEILNLSCNEITRVEGLSHMRQLLYLDLSDNQICDPGADELPKSLITLQLDRNPCVLEPKYRESLAMALPKLQTLDNEMVLEGERAGLAFNIDRPATRAGKFAADGGVTNHKPKLLRQVKAMMTHFDMDQDGYLSFAEANYLMVSTEGGEPMSDDDWPRLCSFFNADPLRGLALEHLQSLYLDEDAIEAFESDLERDYNIVFNGVIAPRPAKKVVASTSNGGRDLAEEQLKQVAERKRAEEQLRSVMAESKVKTEALLSPEEFQKRRDALAAKRNKVMVAEQERRAAWEKEQENVKKRIEEEKAKAMAYIAKSKEERSKHSQDKAGK